MEIAQKVAVLVIFASLIVAEKKFAKRREDTGKLKRSYKVNLLTFLFNDAVLGILSMSSLVAVAYELSDFGFLNYLSVGEFAKGVIAFLLYDLTLYFWHKARHSYEWLWNLHQLHHSDIVMNATTSFRLHIVEVFLTVIVKAAFVIISGATPMMILISETLITAVVMLSHTNIILPFERTLGIMMVTPSAHIIHHGVARKEQSSNFGFSLIVWDRLFGTYNEEFNSGKVGVSGIEEPNFWEMITLSFKKESA